jgi:hypothetical protein
MSSKKLWLAFVIVFALPLAHADEIRNGEDVLRAMHDRYANAWYGTLTFEQKSTTFNPDGTTKVETWHEAASVPGKLRIDVGPTKDGNGYLLVDGTVTIFHDGKETGTRPLVNMLLVLGFDVYRQTPEATIKVIHGEGYDLTKFHEERWNGQTFYVVGADKGDLNSKQFWVEKNRLLFVWLFEPTREDPKKFHEILFEDYRQMSGGWPPGSKSKLMTRKFSARNTRISRRTLSSTPEHSIPSSSIQPTGRSSRLLT